MVSTQDDSRRLYCLIEGESIIFPVDVEHNCKVSSLKEAIQSTRKYSILKNVEPHTLRMWKVNVCLDSLDGDAVSHLRLENLEGDIEKLDQSWISILIHWPKQPPKMHLNIIIKAPSTDVMPTGIGVINEQIKAELKLLQPAVEAFLKNPELPTWVPPDNGMPDIHDFLAGLQMPMYRNKKPSLLLHDLNACDGEAITKIFGTDTPVCICNTSGSGKTRRILEGLTKYWGFYLVASLDGVGIRDLRNALDSVTRDREWVGDLRGVSPEKRAAQNDVNSRIACRAFQKVLAARIVVFQLFLELAIQVDGRLQERHKRIWLLFQLFEPRGGDEHSFIRIFKKLRHASDEALDFLVEGLEPIIKKYFPFSQFILGLDEAQRAARLYPYSGISCPNAEVFRSIIREMVKVFGEAPIKLVVSSTSLPLADLIEDTISYEVQVFHELGMFDTWPKLKRFLERYVPASILETPSGHRLQQRMREYLLGRYGFSASFLEYFLMNGLQSPHKLLNEYLEKHITCLPGDTGDPFTSDERDFFIHVQVRGFDWERLQLDSNAIQDAVKIAQSHLIKGITPEYGPVTANLVDYGIARLREGHMGHIFEPLALVSLMTCLQTECNTNLLADIRLQASETPIDVPKFPV